MTKPLRPSPLAKTGHNEPHPKGKIMTIELKYYLIGCIVIGLPMAIMSVVFYKWDEKFDWSKWKPYLKPVRNFIHPGSFAPLLRPSYEHGGPRANYKGSYEGPIDYFLDTFDDDPEEGGRIVFYIILTSLVWPIRLTWSGVVAALGLVGWIIGLPFVILFFLCKGGVVLFKKAFR